MNNYYFSLVTGEVVQIEKYEIKTLFSYQIPLIAKPKPSCNACYGRGYSSYKKGGIYNPCKCLKKIIDSENFKSETVSVFLPKIV